MSGTTHKMGEDAVVFRFINASEGEVNTFIIVVPRDGAGGNGVWFSMATPFDCSKIGDLLIAC
jgi:hypothetical protein